jgi:hypothetical protein
MQMSDNE